jgi:hypothetical protein
MSLDPRIVIPGAIGLVIALIILSSPLIDVEEVKTEITYQPYSYEQSFIRESQIQKFTFPWFSKVTQVQYMVKNTDSQEGTFVLNFIFDNGIETRTVTKKEDILGGENKAVTVDSPLRGKSTSSLNVVPPVRAIPEQLIVKKKVSAWEFLGRSALDYVFGLK